MPTVIHARNILLILAAAATKLNIALLNVTDDLASDEAGQRSFVSIAVKLFKTAPQGIENIVQNNVLASAKKKILNLSTQRSEI